MYGTPSSPLEGLNKPRLPCCHRQVPYFNAPIFLENKTQIGKVEEILGAINNVVRGRCTPQSFVLLHQHGYSTAVWTSASCCAPMRLQRVSKSSAYVSMDLCLAPTWPTCTKIASPHFPPCAAPPPCLKPQYFTVKMSEGVQASSYSSGVKFYIDPMKLLPMERFLPREKGAAPAWPRGGEGAQAGFRGGLGSRVCCM